MGGSNHQHWAGFEFGLRRVMDALSAKRRQRRADALRPVAAAGAGRDGWEQTFWGRKFMKSVSLSLALLCSASIALADVKITTKSTASGQSFTGTTYIKGSRQRTEGMGYTTIYQCDLKRTIHINDKTKTYFIAADAKGGATGAQPQGQGATARRGGVVTYTTTLVDTGESKQMLGMKARHMKSKTVIEASKGACSTINMEMETDGWYVDIPGGLSCPTDAAAVPQYNQSDCVDEVRFKTVGTAKPGYPVMTTTTMKINMGNTGADADGPPVNLPTSSSTQEVVDLSTATLDAALFDIPAGYSEVKTFQELGSPF